MNRTDLGPRALGTDPASQRDAGTPRVRPLLRLPSHCRADRPEGTEARVLAMQRMLRQRGLHSVCEAARCPNMAGCFTAGTVTFMLLGDVCTRTCRFCNVATGRPLPVDPREPEQVAAAVCELRLAHAVLTSVNRDDLPPDDQGSVQMSRAVQAIRARSPVTTIEVLTPDYKGHAAAIDRVVAARPEVYNHNVECVPRLYRDVRPGARYGRSLELLARVARTAGAILTKSGLMLGLGERESEVEQVLRDLRAAGVACVTLGQYLRPTLRHLEVVRYVDPEEFDAWRARCTELGFVHVAAGPLVRSSFAAADVFSLLRTRAGCCGTGRGGLSSVRDEARDASAEHAKARRDSRGKTDAAV
jgi:lipoic acid synthetase